MAFNARKYEKGSANPEEVRISVHDDYLLISGTENQVKVPIDDLDVNIAGHDEDRIKLTNLLSGEVIMCHEPGLLEQIQNASKHNVVQAQTKSAKSKLKLRSTRMFIYWTFASAIVAGLIISLFLAVDPIASLAIEHISPDLESKFGAVSKAELKQLDTKSAEAKRMTNIGQRLVSKLKDSPYSFHFYLQNSKEVNAFARPGGTIVVMSELIKKAKSDDEIAGIMGHEIGHVLHRDTLRYYAHSAGIWICLELLTGSSGAGEHLQEFIQGMGLQKLEGLQFSRRQESEADLTGVSLALDADYNPEAVVAFFERLKKELPFTNNKLLSLITDHPIDDERIAAIHAEVARLRAQKASGNE